MTTLRIKLEDIPEESLKIMEKIRECDRKRRLHKENLIKEHEKAITRMKNKLRRNMTEIPVQHGRRLVPRSTPFDALKSPNKPVIEDTAKPGFYDF